MENLSQILDIINSQSMMGFFFKAFAFVFSLMYLMYAFVISKQTDIMNKTLESSSNQILYSVASLQVLLGVILIVLSIFLI